MGHRLKFLGAAVVKIASAILAKQSTGENEGVESSSFFLLVVHMKSSGFVESWLVSKEGEQVSASGSRYYRSLLSDKC